MDMLYSSYTKMLRKAKAMTTGERIKKIRIFRHLTMDELGAALGFEGKSMSVRIAQYESGARVPKQDMLLRIAEALNCNYRALLDYSISAAEDIIETLFWLEESSPASENGRGRHFPEYEGPCNLIRLTEMQPTSRRERPRATYKADDYNIAGNPVAVTFEYGLVNDFLSDWYQKKTELEKGEITPAEYFEWKIQWPQNS